MNVNKSDFISLAFTISKELAGQRLDLALSHSLPEHSRGRIQSWIKSGYVSVNNQPCIKMRYDVNINDHIHIHAPAPQETHWQGNELPLNIVFEDDDVIVINKPAGVVVHPAAGHSDDTLVNALLFHCPSLEQLPRAGLIHRLDKDTSGLLVIAKTLEAHTALVTELQAREIERIYLCIANGVLLSSGTVDAPMGRHPQTRTKMAVVRNGKHAVTHYFIEKTFSAHTLLRVKLETGRTHQIRVHMAHIKHPLLGDPIYAPKQKFAKRDTSALIEVIHEFNRQALHATQLSFTHPRTREWLTFKAALPEDMQNLLLALAENEGALPNKESKIRKST